MRYENLEVLKFGDYNFLITLAFILIQQNYILSYFELVSTLNLTIKSNSGAVNLLKNSFMFQTSSEVKLPARMMSSILSATLDKGLPFSAHHSAERSTNPFNVLSLTT